MKSIVLPNETVQATALAIPEKEPKEPVGYLHTGFQGSTDYFEVSDGVKGRISFPESALYNGMERVEPGYLKVPVDGLYSLTGTLNIMSKYSSSASVNFGAYYELSCSLYGDYSSDPLGTKMTISAANREESGFKVISGNIVKNYRNSSNNTTVRYSLSGTVDDVGGLYENFSETPFSCFVTVNGSRVGPMVYFRESLTPGGDRVFSVSGSARSLSIRPDDEIALKVLDYSVGGRFLISSSNDPVQIEVSPHYKHRMAFSVGLTLMGSFGWNPLKASAYQPVFDGNINLSSVFPLKAGMQLAMDYATECPFVGEDYDRVNYLNSTSLLVQRIGDYSAWPLWDIYGL